TPGRPAPGRVKDESGEAEGSLGAGSVTAGLLRGLPASTGWAPLRYHRLRVEGGLANPRQHRGRDRRAEHLRGLGVDSADLGRAWAVLHAATPPSSAVIRTCRGRSRSGGVRVDGYRLAASRSPGRY